MTTHLVRPDEPPRAGSVVLREFTDDDIPMVIDLASDDYVATVSTLPHLSTAGEAHDWIRRQGQRLVDLTGYSFCIADAGTNEALGQIGLWSKGIEEGRATIGYFVAPRARGRRAAGDALAAVTTFAWTLPELHRLEAYIEPWNEASIRTIERGGFRREGLLREHQEIGGRRRDMLLYARLRSDGPVA